jgi:antitoxin VapB
MTQSAKIFINGRSQAVRLPAAYRFDCKEVYIRKDRKTGDIILSSKPNTWDDFITLKAHVNVPVDFMTDREDNAPQERDILNE